MDERYPRTIKYLALLALTLASVLLPDAGRADPDYAPAFFEWFHSVEFDDAASVAKLLARGTNPDITDRKGNTLLILAAKANARRVLKILLGSKAEINAWNNHSETALMLAAYHGHLDVVRELLVHRALVDKKGWTALIYAAFNGHLEIASVLLESGGNVNAATDNGSTALMMAARQGHLEMVKLLLQHGADKNLRSDSGASARDYALKANNTDIARLIREADDGGS
ncbi:MAG: ankyrin repeat domain-containing protein [Burkholderiales bacterium]